MKQAERTAAMRAALVDAIVRLHESPERDPRAPIGVSDVCREADVTRPTFYQYFPSVDALVAAAFAERIAARLDVIERRHPDELAETAGRFFNALQRDPLLLAAIDQGGPETQRAATASIAERLVARHSTGEPDPQAAWRARYAAAGIVEIFAGWFESAAPDLTGDEVVALASSSTHLVMDGKAG